MPGLIGRTFLQPLAAGPGSPGSDAGAGAETPVAGDLAAQRARAVARARSARALLNRRGEWLLDWYDNRLYIGVADRDGVDSQMRGEQPFAARDGSVVVAVDGSLIGANALRRELGRQPFRGNGAAELISRAYAEWGVAGLLARLRGQFAFVLYDRRAGRLILARDAIGSRPLYYRVTPQGVAFASELRVLRQVLDSQPAIDLTAALDFLTYGFVPAPKTLYPDVHKLQAGHWLEVELAHGSASVHCHWAPQRKRDEGQTESDFVARGRELLGRALDDRRLPGRDALFCDVGWALRDYAHERATAGRTRHALSAGEGSDAAAKLEADCRDWFDGPTLSVDLAARAATLADLGTASDVVLCDVGLPIVCGIAPRYRAHRLGRWVERLRGSIRRSARGAGADDSAPLFERYGVALGGLTADLRQQQREFWQIPADYDEHWLFAAHFFPGSVDDSDADLASDSQAAIVGALQRLDLATLVPDRLLAELDALGARAGVEIRTLFLDQDLLDWLLAAPPALAPPTFDVAGALLPGTAGGSLLARMSTRLQRTRSALSRRVEAGRAGLAPTRDRLARLGEQYPEFKGL